MAISRAYPTRGMAIGVLVLMALVSPFLLWSVRAALKSNSNDPQQWLPRHFEEATKYRWFQRHFGQDEITIVSWDGCTIDDPRIDRLAETLVSPEGDGYYARAITGPQLVQQLRLPQLRLSDSKIHDRLRGLVLGQEGTLGRDEVASCLILYLSKKGEGDRQLAVASVFEKAKSVCNLDPDSLHLAGPTVDAATIDVESQRLLLPLAGLSGIMAFLLMWWRLKCRRAALIIFGGSLFATALSLAILYLTGGTMNLVMTMLPPLVYVLSISSAVHLINYYRDAVEVTGAESAPRRMILLGWWPCSLAAFTTAIGLVSLATSEIVPVMMFGFYAAIGVLAGLVVLLVYLPAALRVFPLPPLSDSYSSGADGREESASAARRRRRKEKRHQKVASFAARTVNEEECGEEESRVGGAAAAELLPAAIETTSFARWVMRWHYIIAPACLALMFLTGWGLEYLRSTVRLQYRFGENSRIIRDYRWLEERIGPLIPLEIVVEFAPDSELDFIERLMRVRDLEDRITEVDHVGSTMSAVDFSPALPPTDPKCFRDIQMQRILRLALSEHRDRFESSHLLAKEEKTGQELWRISVRADAFGDVDYGVFTEHLKEALTPMLQGQPDINVEYTGAIPLIYKAQHELLNDLKESFLWAFGIITLLMVFVLRNPVAAILSMLPNIFPPVVVFGLMGWCGVAIEIGTIMTASAALGIAVDDTIHFLTWFRRGTYAGHSRERSLEFAYHHCARAMMHTTLICSVGLLVFTLSSFLPIVRFALLMAVLLVVAIVGDLVFLPAMLKGPVGWFFERRPREK